MHFYCQLDYAHIPYPSPTSPKGTLADNGCGVCCAAMLIEHMTGQAFPPEDAAILAKACGAREGFGTNMAIFAPAFSRKFNLCYTAVSDPRLVLEFLEEQGGMVIANTAGDRADWIGVFSDARHFIALPSAKNGVTAVWDPMLSPGRYDLPGRAGKVHLEGTTAYADFSVIANDCREKAYYLFWENPHSKKSLEELK